MNHRSPAQPAPQITHSPLMYQGFNEAENLSPAEARGCFKAPTSPELAWWQINQLWQQKKNAPFGVDPAWGAAPGAHRDLRPLQVMISSSWKLRKPQMAAQGKLLVLCYRCAQCIFRKCPFSFSFKLSGRSRRCSWPKYNCLRGRLFQNEWNHATTCIFLKKRA